MQNTQSVQISFYVLSENKAQDFLGFICQLTQTALNKSTQSLLILIEDEALISELDEVLWSHDTVSFIPHQRLLNTNNTPSNSESLAPVLLGSYLPANFEGIVINMTSQPINHFIAATSHARPTRILEIIKPDTNSVEQGRNKYKSYQQLGYELTHFKV